VEESLHDKAQLDSSISADRTPICDGQIDGQVHGVAR